MAGLLDGMLDSDSLRLGLGLLAAGGPTTDPNRTGIGQRLQEGMGSFDAYKQNALKQKMLEAQMQQAMEQAAQQKAERARQQTIQQGMVQFFKPGQQALSPLMGDAATGIMPSAGKAAIAPSFDSAGASSFLAQNGEYEQALKLMPKPKELQVNKLDVKDFTPESVQKFAQTGSYADLVRMDKAHFGDSGGQLVAMNPFTGQPLNSINKTQSPDSKASNAVAWANNAATLRGQNMIDGRARDRLSFEQGGGIESGGATQIGFNKQFGKPQAGYRWKPDGSMEFIPGGPADQKAQAQKGGEGTVGGVVADLRDKYTKLDADNGIVSTNNRVGTNLGAAFGSSGVGQFLNGAVGTKTQSSRDSIAMTRPLLLQAIMKATGMSAKQMDSNAELKLYLATATDPQKGLEANLEALDRIESLYGGGNERFKANTPQASTKNGWSMQKVN